MNVTILFTLVYTINKRCLYNCHILSPKGLSSDVVQPQPCGSHNSDQRHLPNIRCLILIWWIFMVLNDDK